MKYKFIVTGSIYVQGSVIIEADNDLMAYEKFNVLTPEELDLKINSLNKDRITYEIIKDVGEL
ncbi:MAG: hypothetical protein EBR82_33010 [Caulobacteraceae bacterium]|jgi:hypothetical protein|nr:hypothetical protein [Caulobacteraceae bacterium]